MDVSIPLWFSRNEEKGSFNWVMKVMFPYHYGSHATLEFKVCEDCKKKEFPYHYGSHATEILSQLEDAEDEFPYHYGSHATSS